MKSFLKKILKAAVVYFFILTVTAFAATPAPAVTTTGLEMPSGFISTTTEDAFLPSVIIPSDIGVSGSTYNWAYQDIVDMLAIKAMEGYPDGTFRPDQAVTRAELATAISNALFLPKAKIVALPDVSKDYWAAQAISNALPYLAAYYDGSFRPESPATREEVAAALIKATGIDKYVAAEPAYIDIIFRDYTTVSPDLKGLVAAAVDKKFIKGYVRADPNGNSSATNKDGSVNTTMKDSYGVTIYDPSTNPKARYSLEIKAQSFVTRAELANSLNNARENSTLGYKTLNK
ncbi:MAG TPA: hypothetical protein DCZ10_09840 [Pelotomaculum sp.]|nr:hypothetical protein [Pelotomaculum sp.]